MRPADARVSGPIQPFVALVRGFDPSTMPALSRANYKRELVASLFLPFLLTGVETGVITVLVRLAFDGVVPDPQLNFIVAMLGASKALANISSFLWVRVNHGRDKLSFTIRVLTTMAVMVALLALVPRTPLGLWIMALGVMSMRFVWSGFLTIRSTIWNANYPRSVRARVTGNFTIVQVILVGLLGLGMGEAMDRYEGSFRILLVAGAGVGSLGILSLSRIRVRGHRRLMRDEAADVGDGRPSFNPLSVVGVLASDRAFAGYMGCMFLLGLGNLMVPPLLAIVLKERFDLGYAPGILITTTLPMLVMPLAIPLCARLLAHLHVVQFRVAHAWVFALANALFFVAAWRMEVWLLYVASIVQGAAFGGGALAWNLGHLDFAPAHRASSYMGVHVTLTGVRGLIAPFLGVSVYVALEHAKPGSGSWVFAISAVLSVLGAFGFLALATRMKLGERERTEGVETLPPGREGV